MRVSKWYKEPLNKENTYNGVHTACILTRINLTLGLSLVNWWFNGVSMQSPYSVVYRVLSLGLRLVSWWYNGAVRVFSWSLWSDACYAILRGSARNTHQIEKFSPAKRHHEKATRHSEAAYYPAEAAKSTPLPPLVCMRYQYEGHTLIYIYF
jgi:hypothetical protein